MLVQLECDLFQGYLFARPGRSPNSVAALRHLGAAPAARPELDAVLEVVDVMRRPELGLRDEMLVIPSSIEMASGRERGMIGHLQDTNAPLALLGAVEHSS